MLPIFGKFFEIIIYSNIFEYLTTNKLISDNQSCFKPGDSCINQLFSITHEIYHSLDNGREVRGVLLDISKVFDRAWHEGLILKLNQCFLKNRKQRVVLNGQTSSWTNFLAGAHQGSILSPLFFLIYINDLSDVLYPPMLNYLQMIPPFFHLCTTKTLQQKNLIMTCGKLVTGPINGKWASTLTLSNKLRR